MIKKSITLLLHLLNENILCLGIADTPLSAVFNREAVPEAGVPFACFV